MNQITTQIFRDRAAAVHPQYDFSQSVYVKAIERVAFICPLHGEVTQTPSSLYAGQGCRHCGNIKKGLSKRKTHAEWIAEARACHGNTYTYARAQYTHAETKLIITCRKHGDFEQHPFVHTRGAGCNTCGETRTGLKNGRTFQQFVTAAQAVHGNAYTYDRASYSIASENTSINCRIHSAFEQRVNHHVMGSGCPDCARTGFDMTKPATLYYLRVQVGQWPLYKIGITNRTVAERFGSTDMAKITILETKRFKLGKWAKAAESQVLRLFTDDRYTGPDLLSSGNSELFTRDVLNLDKEQQ